MSKIRHWFQAAFFAVTNGYYEGFIKGKIYSGKGKYICAPGLNCYSCPGAYNSCPIGSLQAVLDSRKFVFSCYIFGILMAFGAFWGRFICGWMCPFGFVQDLLYKIPVKCKKKNIPGHRYLMQIRWAVFILLVLLLPSVVVNSVGIGKPWFCEFLCPSGTLFGGIPLAVMNKGIRSAAGVRFIWKMLILAIILLLSVFFYRPFCKYLCPLGLFYGMFNPVSFYHFSVDKDKCVRCGECQKVCGMDIKVWENPNSSECIRCGACKTICPNQAISSGCKPGSVMEKKRYLISVSLFVLSVFFIAAGILRGEPGAVISKAVRICMECIGIE